MKGAASGAGNGGGNHAGGVAGLRGVAIAGDVDFADSGLREGIGDAGVASAREAVGGAGGEVGGVGVGVGVGSRIAAGTGGNGEEALGAGSAVDEGGVLEGGEAGGAGKAVVVFVGGGGFGGVRLARVEELDGALDRRTRKAGAEVQGFAGGDLQRKEGGCREVGGGDREAIRSGWEQRDEKGAIAANKGGVRGGGVQVFESNERRRDGMPGGIGDYSAERSFGGTLGGRRGRAKEKCATGEAGEESRVLLWAAAKSHGAPGTRGGL